MKRTLVLLILCSLTISALSQVSIRVKDNPRSKEVSITTGGKKGSGNDNGSSSGPSSTPKTTQPAPADTVAKPTPSGKVDDSYNGPAKVSLRAFWRQLEALRAGTGTPSNLNNAERMLAQVKQQDPNYDVSALETEVAGYRAQANKQAGDKKSAEDKANAAREYFRGIFDKMVSIYSKYNDAQYGGKEYYERVKAIDFAEYKQKRSELSDPGASSYVKSIDEALADYNAYVTRSDRLKWNVTEKMTKSRGASNPQEKTALLEDARYECMGVLLMVPDNAAFKQKLDEINKLMGAADAEAAKYYTSDFHKANLNKIVWSTQPLVIGKEKDMAAVIKNDFKTGDYVYGTAYLGVKASAAMGSNTNLRVRIKVDNGTAVWGGDLSYFELPIAAQDKSYIQFALIPDAQWLKDHYAPYLAEENWTIAYLLDELARSGDVSHAITCELMFPTSAIDDIDGALNLDLNAGSSAIKDLSSKLNQQMMATRQLPKAGMNNPALAKQCLDAANGLGWNDKFLSCIITSFAWVTAKNELTGAILYRYIGAVCTLKGNDGKCYYQEFGFRQDYTGGGNYSSVVKYHSYGGKREIGCDKFK